MPINVFQATLGATVQAPTLEGEVELEVPAGTQPGQTFTLKGKGVPHLRSRQRGDQLVTVQVEIPAALTEEQRAVFKELGSMMGDENFNENGKGFFDKLKDALGAE
jgi:molecular chaperone DnaJ